MTAHIEVVEGERGPTGETGLAVFALALDHVLHAGAVSDASAQLASHLRSQIDLIRSVARPGSDVALALRYSSPGAARARTMPVVDVSLLVRVRVHVPELTRAALGHAAGAMAAEMLSVLKVLLPTHRWRPVADADEFHRLWNPLDWGEAYVAEIRRREDLVDLVVTAEEEGRNEASPSSPTARASRPVYLVKPMSPRLTTMRRVLHLMLLHESPLVFQVTLAPTELMAHESERLRLELIGCWPRLSAGASGELMSEVGVSPKHDDTAAGGFLPAYAAAIESLLMNRWLRLQGTPVLMCMSVAGTSPVPMTIMQSIGVELTRPTGDEGDFGHLSARLLTGEFDIAVPETAEELDHARQNLSTLAIRPWGESRAPRELRRLRYLLDPVEAAGAFRLPVALSAVGGSDGAAAGPFLPGIRVRPAVVQPVDGPTAEFMRAASIQPDLTRLGLATDVADNPLPIFLNDTARRQHVYVAGQTGTGKTTLLKGMILSDIAAGHGVAVLDPHGDLFAELLTLIPPERADDVVVLDPTDVEFPIGLNLLQADDELRRWTNAREMRAVMERLLADHFGAHAQQWTGPLFYQHMQMNMLLAMSNPQDPGTLLEFHQIFRREKYWRRWLPLAWDDPQLRTWVEEALPKVDYGARKVNEITIGEYVATKFDDFVLDPMLRLIFGQKRSTIDLAEIMDGGKILLVNLAKGALTEANSRFLGMVLMGQLQAVVLRRVRVEQARRKLFCIYADEFQNLATENFGLLLSEARKFGISLTLANQFTSQIQSRGLLDAVFGNVGTLVAFRVGGGDVGVLEPYFGKGAALSTQPNHHALVRSTVGGHVAPPFTLRTELPEAAPNATLAETIRAASRRRYGRPRAQVMAEIERGLAAPIPAKPPTPAPASPTPAPPAASQVATKAPQIILPPQATQPRRPGQG